jgi:hypothetical protein
MSNCPHCGMIHQTTCPRVKAIEYNPDGTVRRIEFHTPTAPIAQPQHVNLRIIDGIANSFGGVVVRE